MKISSRAALLIATALGCGTVAPAHAQARNAPEASDATAIIVTARRVEERLQDVPISITVFNQQQLTDRNVVSASDLAAYTPSLQVNTNFGSQNSSFAIRGFVQDSGTAPAVGVYFADVVAPRAASNGIPAGDGAGPGSFFDLQNVQVLKGPQGTLFGRNTTGGAVLLVPQKPTDKLEGYVQGSLGNYDMRRVQAVLNIPLSDTFRVRLGVDRMKRAGYLHNTSGIGPSDFDDTNYIAARASIVGDLTPNLENYIIASYSRSNTHGDVQKLVAADPLYSLGGFAAPQLSPGSKNYQGSSFYDIQQDLPDARSTLSQWQVIDTTTWKATDTLTMKNIISYAQLKDYYQNPIFATGFLSPAIPQIGLQSYAFNFAASQVYPGHQTADESTFTEEFRLQGSSADSKFTWQAGAYLEAERPLEVVGSQSATLQACGNPATFQCYDILGYLGAVSPVFFGGSFNPNSHGGSIGVTAGKTSFNDKGIYAQATYKLSDKFKVTGGLRYTWDSEDLSTVQTTTLTGYPLSFPGFQPIPAGPLFTFCTYPDAPNQNPAAAGGCTRTFHQSSHAPTWLIDFDYTPSRDVLAYAKYARGYRTGGVAPNVSPPLSTFQPEKVDAYEVGLKTSWHGMIPGTFDVSGFYNDFQNQQLQLGFNLNPCQTTNAQGQCVPATVAPTAAPANAGKSRMYGLEFEGTINPFTGFALQAGYTYLNTKIVSIPTFASIPGSPYVVAGAYLPGDPLELSPRNKYTVTATYTLPLDRSMGRLSVGLTFTHTDSMFVNPSDRYYTGCTGVVTASCSQGGISSPATVAAIRTLGTLQATNLLNGNLSWNSVGGSPIDLAAFVSNLTNAHYYTFTSALATGTGFENSAVGAPRMYGASVKVKF
jgi:iron complex outermembrane receptor protein